MQVVPAEEMVARLVAARRGRSEMVIMARTDAAAVTEIDQFEKFAKAIPGTPLLANLTEFGKTPLWHLDELAARGVSMVLYPLSAFRAQSRAAEETFKAILRDGTNKEAEKLMHHRMQTYEVIDYMSYEKAMDEVLKSG